MTEQTLLKLSLPIGGHVHHPQEDSIVVNLGETAVLAVADGVTRTPNRGVYPVPSPATLAAQAFCSAAQAALKSADASETSLAQAFLAGNHAIRQVNDQLGLSDRPDYGVRDLAGTVAALALLKGNRAVCGYIGDCGLAILNPQGRIKWQTPDDVRQAARHFPPLQGASRLERQIRIRRDYRNKPEAPFPTYGVLTGEEAAMEYVRLSVHILQRGETLAVYSDGALPLLADASACSIIASLHQDELEAYVAARRPANDDLIGEISLLAIRAT